MINPAQYKNYMDKIKGRMVALAHSSFVYNPGNNYLPTVGDAPIGYVDFNDDMDDVLIETISVGDYELDEFENYPFNKLPEQHQNKIIQFYENLVHDFDIEYLPYSQDFLNYLKLHTKPYPKGYIPSTVVSKPKYENGLCVYPDSIDNLLDNMRKSNFGGNTKFMYHYMVRHGVVERLFYFFDSNTPVSHDLATVLEHGHVLGMTNFYCTFGAKNSINNYINLFVPTDQEVIDFFYDLGVAAGYIIHSKDKFAVDIPGLASLYESVFTAHRSLDLSAVAHRLLVEQVEPDSDRDFRKTILTMKAYLDFNHDFVQIMYDFFDGLRRTLLTSQVEYYKIAASNITQPKIIEFRDQFSW